MVSLKAQKGRDTEQERTLEECLESSSSSAKACPGFSYSISATWDSASYPGSTSSHCSYCYGVSPNTSYLNHPFWSSALSLLVLSVQQPFINLQTVTALLDFSLGRKIFSLHQWQNILHRETEEPMKWNIRRCSRVRQVSCSCRSCVECAFFVYRTEYSGAGCQRVFLVIILAKKPPKLKVGVWS